MKLTFVFGLFCSFTACLNCLFLSQRTKQNKKYPITLEKKYAEQTTSHHLLACEQALINSAAGSMFFLPKRRFERSGGDAHQGSGTNC